MEYQGTWKEIWTKKGMENGTANDIKRFDGWEKSETEIQEIAEKIIHKLEIQVTDTVLEVGCGAGGMAQFMQCNYIGIDFSKPLTEKCMSFFSKPAIYSEANDIPFRDKYFDKCFCWGVFLYFPSHEYMREVVAEMKRVVQGGIFIGDIPLKSHNERHMTYTKEEFKELGFEIMRGWAVPYEDDRFNAFCINSK